MADKSKEVATKQPSEIALGDQFREQISKDADLGLEDVSYEDLLIPRLKIIQDGSPERKEKNKAYMPGVSVGDIIDSTYGVSHGNSILFIPAVYIREYIEWKPREQGGGLAGIHQDRKIMDSARRNDQGRMVLPNGNTISPTMNFFGFVPDESGFKLVVISMASTQLKKGRKLVTLANQERMRDAKGAQFVPPLYARAYVLGTAFEDNAKGDWYGWTIQRGIGIDQYEEFDGFNPENFLRMVRNTIDAIRSNAFRVEPEDNPEKPEGASGNSGDDIPF